MIKQTKIKSNKTPLVSVIMPVYNAEGYLAEAVKSILGQTYRNFEFIVVDDGSTDRSWKIIRKFAKRYSRRIKAYRLKKTINYAGNGAVNYGYRFAKGDYIVRMDADDIAMPKRLKKQVEFMEKHPEVILSGTQAYVIDGKGTVTGRKNVPLAHEKIYDEYGVVHPIIHPTVMIRRSLLPQKDRIYEKKFGINSDYYTFFRLLKYGKFANMGEYLLKYRVHSGNFSYKKPKERFINSFKIRVSAIIDLDYKISLKSAVMMTAQTMLVLLLPEKYIVPVYLTIRGMNSPREFIVRNGAKFATFLQKQTEKVIALL